MRSVRKVTVYLCTVCYRSFPDSPTARKHLTEAHSHQKRAKQGAKRTRRGPTQTSRVLAAVQGGATTAKEVARRTKLPLARVHSLLTYLRKRGKITGFADDLKLVQ